MATAQGPGPSNAAELRGFDYDASAVAPLPGYDITPFGSLWGARVGQGDVFATGRADLMCAADRAPAASSEVRAYAYSGVALQPLSGTPFVPFPPGYGVNVSGGAFGW